MRSAVSNKSKWQQTTYKEAAERPVRFSTISDLELESLYDPSDVRADYDEALGYPGQYPYTRGVYGSMYRGRLWTMRQFAGFGLAEDTNKRFHYLLSQGQDGLSTAFDMPTLMGYDADHGRAMGEVGREGVSVTSIHDMARLFDRIPMDRISTSMTVNCSASVLLAMYLVVAERHGVPWEKVSGTIQNDMLKEFTAQKEWICPPAPAVRIVTDMVEFCARRAPRWHPISISGYHIREAGSTAAQELAFTIADGIAYVEAAVKAGLAIDSFASRLSFFFNVHNNFFEEVAKFRAARKLWAHIMKERFGAKDERSMMMRFHAQTAGSTLTAQQVDNNVVRVTLQALAAVLGGAQSLHTNSKDEALALPTESSVLLALRTQQLIANESGVADTVDPLAGSYYLETLTRELEVKAQEYLSKIDDFGGAVAAIERGYMQREIQNAAFLYQREIETKDRIIVGVNQFTQGGGPPGETLKVNPDLEQKQQAKLAKVRAERNSDAAKSALAKVESAARDGGNLMPTIIDAVRSWCTLGEISDAMRRVFGEYQPVNVV